MTKRYSFLHLLILCNCIFLTASLLLTPFAVAVVPPPMSLFNAKFKSAVNHVCFSNDPGSLVVGLSNSDFCLLNVSMDKGDAKLDFEDLHISRY